jgi:hypothetical protein
VRGCCATSLLLLPRLWVVSSSFSRQPVVVRVRVCACARVCVCVCVKERQRQTDRQTEGESERKREGDERASERARERDTIVASAPSQLRRVPRGGARCFACVVRGRRRHQQGTARRHDPRAHRAAFWDGGHSEGFETTAQAREEMVLADGVALAAVAAPIPRRRSNSRASSQPYVQHTSLRACTCALTRNDQDGRRAVAYARQKCQYMHTGEYECRTRGYSCTRSTCYTCSSTRVRTILHVY